MSLTGNQVELIKKKKKYKTKRKSLVQENKVIYLNPAYSQLQNFDYPLHIRIINKTKQTELESNQISMRLSLLKIPHIIIDKFTVTIDYPHFANLTETVECQSSGSFYVKRIN